MMFVEVYQKSIKKYTSPPPLYGKLRKEPAPNAKLVVKAILGFPPLLTFVSVRPDTFAEPLVTVQVHVITFDGSPLATALQLYVPFVVGTRASQAYQAAFIPTLNAVLVHDGLLNDFPIAVPRLTGKDSVVELPPLSYIVFPESAARLYGAESPAACAITENVIGAE